MTVRPTPASRSEALGAVQTRRAGAAGSADAVPKYTTSALPGIAPNANSPVIVYADGLCEPVNPGGCACWAWVALQDGQEIATDSGCLGYGPAMTNNRAEYHQTT